MILATSWDCNTLSGYFVFALYVLLTCQMLPIKDIINSVGIGILVKSYLSLLNDSNYELEFIYLIMMTNNCNQFASRVDIHHSISEHQKLNFFNTLTVGPWGIEIYFPYHFWHNLSGPSYVINRQILHTSFYS